MVPNKCSEDISYYCLVGFWTITLTFDSILLCLLYCSRFEMSLMLLSYCLSLIYWYFKRMNMIFSEKMASILPKYNLHKEKIILVS